MESDKSQGLQSANWRPKGADGIVLDKVWKAENQGSWQYSSSPNSSKLEAQKEPRFQFKSDGREKTKQNKLKIMTQLEGSQAGGVASYSRESQHFYSFQTFNWLEEAHPH